MKPNCDFASPTRFQIARLNVKDSSSISQQKRAMAAAAKAAATAAAAMHCAVVPDTPSRKLAEKAAERRSKRGSTRPADAAALEKLNGMSRGAFYARGMPPPVAGAGGKGAKANIADEDANGASAATAGEDGKAAGVVVHKGALPNAHVVGACSLHGPKGMQRNCCCHALYS